MKRILLCAILMIQTSSIFSQTVINNDSTKVVHLPKWIALNVISELKTTDLIIEQKNLIQEQNDLQKRQIDELFKLNKSFAENLIECENKNDICQVENIESKRKIEYLSKQSKNRKRNFILTVGIASILLILK